ncbi:DUF6799 domain-containing protein [Rufibacter tibetensis]|uniref:DUF6799 domain-containing protein n=1 Tax=Rufibacter tibetensis TaxID=512763 RepID=A0A0P0C3F8_9BACT|nr:DUF6799 domain-containing protein [Rufibacter tibetensis]ALI99290.1 hypothetical protein DC20_10255 [Rufibacter tibetensis]
MKRTILYSLVCIVALSCAPYLSTAQQTSDSLITRSTIKDNTIFWQQGKLVQHKGGRLFEVQEPVQYSNGTVISPNGQVRLPNGKNYMLKQKNAISPQGNVVLVADDIFTHNTIVEHEKKVVGDTEVRIVTVDGQIVSAGNNKQQFTYPTAKEKRIQLLEQMVNLMEQRTALLEANLTPAERKSIEAYYNGLNKQLASVNQQLQALSPPAN